MDVTSPFRLPRKTPFGVGEHVTEWATGLKKLNQFYAARPVGGDMGAFLRYALDTLGIQYSIQQGSLAQFPAIGATVVVANHPLGCVEGVILAELIRSVRKDIKVLANHYLKTLPELDELFIGVDVFDGPQAVKANIKALREAQRHLANGGLLLMFPAGEVSAYNRKTRSITDKEWSHSVSRLISKSKATTVPVYIDGKNSRKFYMAGRIHPLLRTLMLGRELLNKRDRQIDLAIGEAISYKEIKGFEDSKQLVNYLRLNTYLLGSQLKSLKRPKISTIDIDAEPIVSPVSPAILCQEISQLNEGEHLLSSGSFDVYCASGPRIPSVMAELGRLREINFRAVGEGTGKATDIDGFDQYYHHLFVWDRDRQCLVGAYRLGLVDRILASEGVGGLYSRTLFNYDERFIHQQGNAIELGRSVIAADYQKSLSALMLLWKGIATFVYRHPRYTHLFGPVSISNDYSPEARHLLAESMAVHHYDMKSAELVSASNPLVQTVPLFWQTEMLSSLADIQLLSKVISRLEGGKGVPVLLRQYLGLNGKLVCFNVDSDFNDALDGLIVVDLRGVPAKTLGKYMGKSEVHAYFAQCESSQ
ncbi:lysophospholipid acyltransferase family protein [Photobacterium lutimaris]|uniref:L-ornithine N(alpha)-acyltransferase n=1 Tax=Photobacterium lutimaris TaxID=388278 RepID=A0A2T3J2X5_9GAMM|nr:GNAT family N-acyltransferase [Photobacterium lutimaris]PSU35648.1 hemolysin [Photobacterium lutimaris]TDR78702.1 putative hemolysin [Photobacterium lutimaris]